MGAALSIGSASARQQGGVQGLNGHKHLVARIPASSVDIEFDAAGKGRKLKETLLTPLDSLARDGWQLVSVVRDDTGEYVCFFRK
jgi:hypothetical protein